MIILSVAGVVFFYKPSQQQCPIVTDDVELQVFTTIITNFVENIDALSSLNYNQNKINKPIPNDFESIDLN